MASRVCRSAILATAVLSWWMLLGESSYGQEAGPPPAASLHLDRPVGLGDFLDFDVDQETPAPPATPAPVPDLYPNGPPSSRFLLGDVFGLPSGRLPDHKDERWIFARHNSRRPP